MPQKSSGGIRILQVFGISVYLHWTWFLVLFIAIERGRDLFHSNLWQVWSIAACLLLFAIVLLHEFGHALACRSVGGTADRIVLWPLGGLAFVMPPPRAGALLWSIVAGPLVNVVILVLSLPFVPLVRHMSGDGAAFLSFGLLVNTSLLVFNLIPVYPLDGGQIVQALLWFVIGRRRSLAASGWIGIVVAGLAVVGCLYVGQWWLALIAAFCASQSWIAIKRANLLRDRDLAPRHTGWNCPACHASPPAGPLWQCPCGQPFDLFAHNATCPHCGRRFHRTTCMECGHEAPVAQWLVPLPPLPLPPAVPPLPAMPPPPLFASEHRQ